MEDQFY